MKEVLYPRLLWLVGFYEGEGSCGVYTTTRYIKGKKYVSYQLSVSISQKNEEIIRKIREWTGIGNVSKADNSGINGITMWRWMATNAKARKFLQTILCHMHHPGKIKQAEEALEKEKNTVKLDYMVSDDEAAQMKKLYDGGFSFEVIAHIFERNASTVVKTKRRYKWQERKKVRGQSSASEANVESAKACLGIISKSLVSETSPLPPS